MQCCYESRICAETKTCIIPIVSSTIKTIPHSVHSRRTEYLKYITYLPSRLSQMWSHAKRAARNAKTHHIFAETRKQENSRGNCTSCHDFPRVEDIKNILQRYDETLWREVRGGGRVIWGNVLTEIVWAHDTGRERAIFQSRGWIRAEIERDSERCDPNPVKL